MIAAIVLARSLGWLQPLEWMAFDRLLLLRPAEPLDDRMVIVGINESDIRKLKTYPVPDGEIAAAIAKIQQYKPIAIGLDIFRDLPVEPGHQKLTQLFRSSPNLFAIEQILSGRTEFTVSPPAMLPPEQVGFADAVLDSDGYLRRSLLGSADPNNSSNFKFSLTARLADAYLQATRKLELTKGSENNPDAMQFGSTTLTQFLSNSGSYVGADAGGYQVLLNFRSGQHPFRILSLSDLKAGKFQPDWIRGHIVLIGVTALSVKDVVNSAAIPSSNPGLVNGVEVQAHAVSQIISAVTDDRPLLKTWADGWETLWIVGWGLLGMVLGRMLRSPWRILLTVGIASVGLGGICYGLIIFGWWVPLVPALMGLVFNGAGLTAALFYRHEQEIRTRLKDRQQVIDQTFDAIHAGPLQQLANLLRVIQDNPIFPKPFVAELHLLNRDLRAVHDSMQKETLNQEDSLSLSSQLDLDLQSPLHLVLEQVYNSTLERDFPNFQTIKAVFPQFEQMDDRTLTASQKRSLCRFLEEALCKVGKHAIAPTKLWIFCGQENGYQIIRVKDNGIIDQSKIHVNHNDRKDDCFNQTKAGLGTQQARGLAKQLQGNFQRFLAEPQGTVCELVWQPTKLWFR